MRTGGRTLPPELRNMILEYVRTFVYLHYPVYVGIPSPRHAHFARLSSVSREWRNFFSHRIDIAVNQFRLHAFRLDFQTQERQARVRRIRFHVKLTTYECRNSPCTLEEEPETKMHHGVIFLNALRNFMAIMSTWSTAGRGDRGIELDIGAYSPSDARHYHITNEADADPVSEWTPRTDANCPFVAPLLHSIRILGDTPPDIRLNAYVGQTIRLEEGHDVNLHVFFPYPAAPVFSILTVRSQ